MFLWEEMKLLILKQFRSTQEGSLHEQFLALRQQGTVKEYWRKFIEFLAPLDNVSDEITLSQFINGLNPEIQNEQKSTKGSGCDEKWSPGHKCKKKKLNVLITYDEEDKEEPEEAPVMVDEPVLEATEISKFTEAVEVSLNSVVGLTTPKTMKMKGIVCQQQVVILIDPGATHNFISANLVQKLKLPITRIEAYGVTMGTGDSVRGEGICKGVTLHLQGINIVEDFLPLGLGSSDVILGIQWLATLGMTHTNWKLQVMKFQLGNESVTLRSDPSLKKTLVSLKAMMRTCKHEGGLLVELNQVTIPIQTPVVPEFLIHVVEKYANVFQMPTASNRVAYALSRISERAEIAAISVPQWQYWDQLKSELEHDEFIKIIREDITSGRQPHFGFIVLQERGSSLVSAVDNLLEDRDAILNELRMHLLRAQQKMKMYADAKRHNLEFAVWDLVFLKLRPYRQISLAQRRYDKMVARFYGPFKVLAGIGKVAYKHELPPTAAIHPIFHVSQLRQALGVTVSVPTLPPQLSTDLELVVVPESLLGVRPKSVATPGHMEVLIKWKSLPTFEATWEDYLAIVNQFLEFHLGDKVNVWAGCNVRQQIRFTYSRRKGKAGNNN
ncbi:hypothetical protein EZV62_015177 [Acer yangbiense]|uniref:Chromo domain-containing protein n=1 Tax=Acer yangbiense TaxID=1000413 RepID=A0A5C7HUZ0_9ROSI|nr:hypothetical protein EZV62_015177 [Acer yangbiense]